MQTKKVKLVENDGSYSLESKRTMLIILSKSVARLLYTQNYSRIQLDANREKKSHIPVTVNRDKLTTAMFTEDHYFLKKESKIFTTGLYIERSRSGKVIITFRDAFVPISDETVFQEIMGDVVLKDVKNVGHQLILTCILDDMEFTIKLSPHQETFRRPFREVEKQVKKIEKTIMKKRILETEKKQKRNRKLFPFLILALLLLVVLSVFLWKGQSVIRVDHGYKHFSHFIYPKWEGELHLKFSRWYTDPERMYCSGRKSNKAIEVCQRRERCEIDILKGSTVLESYKETINQYFPIDLDYIDSLTTPIGGIFKENSCNVSISVDNQETKMFMVRECDYDISDLKLSWSDNRWVLSHAWAYFGQNCDTLVFKDSVVQKLALSLGADTVDLGYNLTGNYKDQKQNHYDIVRMVHSPDIILPINDTISARFSITAPIKYILNGDRDLQKSITEEIQGKRDAGSYFIEWKQDSMSWEIHVRKGKVESLGGHTKGFSSSYYILILADKDKEYFEYEYAWDLSSGKILDFDTRKSVQVNNLSEEYQKFFSLIDLDKLREIIKMTKQKVSNI